jgi:tetratricopeptide (TPR) repeat protein
METKTQPSAGAGRPAPDRTTRIANLKRLIGDSALDLVLMAVDNELKAVPNDPDFWALKSVALEKSGKIDDAYAAMQKAVEFKPGAKELRVEMARLANARGNEADEVEALNSTLALGPMPEKLLMRLIQLRAKRQEFNEALRIADQLVAAKPRHEPFVMKRIGVLADAGRYKEAQAAAEVLLNTEEPTNLAVTTWAALTVENLRDHDTAIAKLKELIAKGKASWFVYSCLGKALSQVDRAPEAVEIFRRATEIAPQEATNWYDLGVLQRQLGEIKASQQSINRSLELDPTNAGALRVAGYEHKYAYGDDSFRRLNICMAKVETQPKKLQVEVHYAMAKALEDVGELEAAFGHYAWAGRIQKELTPWSDTRMRGVYALLRNFVRPADLEAVRQQAVKTNKPVFVFGMPRSGTTLLEQVIASHPQAYGAGELKLGAGIINGLQVGRARLETMYEGQEVSLADGRHLSIPERGKKYLEIVEKLAGPKAVRVVDKMPGNYNWVGVLDAILPGSYFIHSRRHPVEICLSEYRLFFPDGISFSYDLRDLGKAYRLYHDYMSLWTEQMGDKILHVRYEDMVADLETEARRIIDYIGLPWDDACLRFYETERKVVTASVSQVRKPIYTTSTNRWRKYEPYLKPLLDELGPLVAEYEEELAQADAKRKAAAAAVS